MLLPGVSDVVLDLQQSVPMATFQFAEPHGQATATPTRRVRVLFCPQPHPPSSHSSPAHTRDADRILLARAIAMAHGVTPDLLLRQVEDALVGTSNKKTTPPSLLAGSTRFRSLTHLPTDGRFVEVSISGATESACRFALANGLLTHNSRHKIHRDIKPSNICLDSAGNAKLSDFGITTSLENTLAACNSFVGTSAWMSPERLMGHSYKYASDVWAIAIVFLECATGRFPYEITGVYLDMMQSIINGPAPSLPRQSDGTYGKFSKEFAHFLDCALAKDPEKRSTAEELLTHPWFKKQAQINPRSPAQMAEWAGKVKVALQAKQRAAAAGGNGSGGGQRDPSLMDTSTNGQVIGVSVGGSSSSMAAAASVDPFVAGYNNTETALGQSGQQGRYNIADSAGSFYQVKPMQ